MLGGACRTTQPGSRSPRFWIMPPVVEPVGREAGVAQAPQARRDDLEPGRGERTDVPRPDALRLRPAVREEQRRPVFALPPEGELHALPHRGAADRKGRSGHARQSR